MATVGLTLLPRPALAISDFDGVVNSSSAGRQDASAVAMAADGSYVVVWSGPGDGSSTGIFGQRYTSDGFRQGPEMGINTTTLGAQTEPSVAMNSDGRFTVVWKSSDGMDRSASDPACAPTPDAFAAIDCSATGIRAARFTVVGMPIGNDFLVNNSGVQPTVGRQAEPDVAIRDNGDTVVTWSDDSNDGSGWGVFARLYPTGGAPGPIFMVPTSTTGDQISPSVAAGFDGSLVFAWASGDGQDTPTSSPACGLSSPGAAASIDCSGGGIRIRGYGADNVAQGADFLVNGSSGTATIGDQHEPDVGLRGNGGIVVVWTDAGPVGGPPNISGRSFPTGPIFRINSTETGEHGTPSLAVSRNGLFDVAWRSTDGGATPLSDPACGGVSTPATIDCSGTGIRARRFDATNQPLTLDRLVNGSPSSRTGSNQHSPAIAAAERPAVITWTTENLVDGSQSAIEGAVSPASVPGPQPPVATADGFTVAEDATPTAFDILANDSDPDGDLASYAVASGPTNGILTSASPPTYSPAANFHGTDSFIYRAVDAGGRVSNPVTVTITVTPVNDAPVANADSANVAGPMELDVLANDTDADGDALTASVVTPPSKGSLTALATGKLRYEPAAGAAGTDSFTYRATDGSLNSQTVTVTLALPAPPAHSYTAAVQQPINASGETSTFRAGRGVIPVKWALTDGGASTCTQPPADIRLVKLTGTVESDVDESVYSGNADSGSAYRVADCRYHFNLSAKSLTVGTYEVAILIDGQPVGKARFELR